MADIQPHVGVTEDDIVHAALLLSFNLDIGDIRRMYADRGRSAGDAFLAYCAAQTYLTIQGREYKEDVVCEGMCQPLCPQCQSLLDRAKKEDIIGG